MQDAYAYDKLGNVTSRTQAWNTGISGGAVPATSYTESFTYDGLNRLASSTVTGGTEQRFTYGPGGNLASKTGNGNYHYLTNGVTQPHAVSGIDNLAGSFSYDADGNALSGNGRSTSWTSFDMPATITRGGNSSTFAYGPDHERTSQQESNNGVSSKVFYGDAQEVQLNSSNSVVSVKTYWPNGIGVEIDRPGQSQSELDWTHTDRLGSIVAITDVNGNVKEALGFDAWGSRRLPGGTTAVTPTSTPVTESTDDKGFTGQEMLDPLELVHFNGRVYDPIVGKFLSGDPHVTDPLNGQNYNRYSYVLNNPTNLTDPTGFDVALPTVTITARAIIPDWDICTGPCIARLMGAVRAGANSRFIMIAGRAVPVAGSAYLGWKAGGWWYENYGSKYVANSGPSVNDQFKQDMDAIMSADDSDADADALNSGGSINNAAGTSPPGGDDDKNKNDKKKEQKKKKREWDKARERYWKNRAANAEPGEFSDENLELELIP